VDIDGLEGPSEIVIVADETASPALCAADLLAQAEHDPLALAVLITTSADLAKRVDKEIEMQLGRLKQRSSIRKAIDAGVLVVVDDMSQAVELVNLFAPEHLSIMAANALTLARRVRNAGCIFVGENSPIVLGDYVAGPSHVLPTGGSARFGSPLSVADFLKVTNVIAFDGRTMRKLSQPAVEIARAEGMDAHAEAVARRVTTSAAKRYPGRSSKGA
jgi:histidinol dehydrogenase